MRVIGMLIGIDRMIIRGSIGRGMSGLWRRCRGGGARVLDLGCGSGMPVGRYLAESGLLVTGVDASPTLISLCRERLPAHEWMVGEIGFAVIAHAVEDWQTGGGRTVWLARRQGA